MSDTETSILKFIGELKGDGTLVGRDTPIMETGLLDSMALVQLIQFIGQKFGVTIPDEEVTPELFESPMRIAAYVDGRIA
jgi:acyl carrier protein